MSLSSRARRFVPQWSFLSPSSFVSNPSMVLIRSPLSLQKTLVVAKHNQLSSMRKDWYHDSVQHRSQHQRKCRHRRRYLRQEGHRLGFERQFSRASWPRMISSESKTNYKHETMDNRSPSKSSSLSTSTTTTKITISPKSKPTTTTSQTEPSLPSSRAEHLPPMTMEGLWKDSTARMLDRETTPLGSMTSLDWHLAETLLLYWSTFSGEPPKNRRMENRAGTSNAETDWFEAASEGHRLCLRLLDRFKEEKIDAEDCNPSVTSNDELVDSNDIDDDDDFRTLDISLIHAVLKQWKDCLRWANHNNKKNYDRNNNRHSRHQQQYQNNDQQSPSINYDIILPSKLLPIIDHLAVPVAAPATAAATAEENKTSPLSSTPVSLFEPNIATYTILMDGAVSCRNYRERVSFTDDLLDRLLRDSVETPRLTPTVVTIGTAIHALANTRTLVAAETAEEWLRKIPELPGVDGEPMRSNTVVYTTVIRAWADVGRADRAEGLLREMCNDYVGVSETNNSNKEKGNPDAKPSLWTFNTVLAAWSRSKNPSSVIQAEGLIRTMKSFSKGDEREHQDPSSSSLGNSDSILELDVVPTIVSYNSLMSTIASRSNQPDSLAKAQYWMEEILANASAVSLRRRTPATNRLPGNRHRNTRGNNTGRKGDDSMAPNFITYKALFNIVSSARNLSNTEKADRMRYWLARAGASTPSVSSPGQPNSTEMNQRDFGSNTTNLSEHPYLLEQIERTEQQPGNNNRT